MGISAYAGISAGPGPSSVGIKETSSQTKKGLYESVNLVGSWDLSAHSMHTPFSHSVDFAECGSNSESRTRRLEDFLDSSSSPATVHFWLAVAL